MIIEHDAKGEITHIRFDPVPAGVEEMLAQMEIPYIEMKPEKVFGPRVDPDTLEPEFDDDAQPVIEQLALQEPEAHIRHHYVDVARGTVEERPAFDVPERVELVADGRHEVTISGLPNPCLVKIEGEEMKIEDGEIVLSADTPASYQIELIQWPFIPTTVEVLAHAAEAE